MRLISLECLGLFSYKQHTKIEFDENTTVIVGPNDSGKSNIFRIISKFVKALASPRFDPPLKEYEIFQGVTNPFIEIKLHLTSEETNAVIDYLSFYQIYEGGNRAVRSFEFHNRDFLSNTLNEISIKLSWNNYRTRYDGSLNAKNIEISFTKIDLKLHSSYLRGSLSLMNEHDIKDSPIIFRKFLDSLSDKIENQDSIKSKGNTSNPIGDSWQDLRFDAFDETCKKRLSDFLSYTGQGLGHGQDLTLLQVIGILLDRSFHYASGKRNYLGGQLDYVEYLTNDGSNLAQFLYSLKMSSDTKRRKRFDLIRDAFKAITQYRKLSFDVVTEFKEDEKQSNTYGEKKRQPTSSQIVIIDTLNEYQVPLDHSGTGLGEIIYLVTLAYGLEESIVILDEPATNLHPPQMKALMQKLFDGNTGKHNQFLIITHSAELMNLLIFRKKTRIFRIGRENGVSTVGMLDEKTQKWFDTEYEKLQHVIDTRIFLGKRLILTEGDSDSIFLTECARYFATKDPSLDINNNDIMIINVNGKNNFPNFRDLLESFKVPYTIIGDEDTTTESKERVREVFKSPSFITRQGIEGANPRIFTIKDGDLEDFMKQIDERLFAEAYEQTKKDYGKKVSKPALAHEFIRKITQLNPSALEPIKKFLEITIKN